MASIRHRVGIMASPERVYDALTTRDGLMDWWTRTIDGESAVGGRLQFFFGGPEASTIMEVTELAPATHVEWRCVAGPDEWVGTRLTFDLKPDAEGETVLLFTHADWREPVEFMYHCSAKWAYYLLGLKSWLEGGESVAYPNDAKISSWG